MTTACTAPSQVPAASVPARTASVTPVVVVDSLQSPITTQSNLRYAFGASDEYGRAYPGWMLDNEAASMQLTAMADGVVVMNVPLLLGRTAFVRIQLRSERYDIEYIVASKKPLPLPALSPRQQVSAGDILYEAVITAPEYAAISVVDRATMMHVCPTDIIDTTETVALEQRLHRRAAEWCVSQQLPYTDSGLLIPIKGYENAEVIAPQPTATGTAPTATVLASPQAMPPATLVSTPQPTETGVPSPTSVPATSDAMGPLIYPVRDIAQIRIMEAYSTDASAPWGFAHNGIDFMTDRDREPVLASADGTITRVDVKQFPPLNNWQINISLRVNNRYTIGYAFEPMTSDDTVGQAQQTLISVKIGQSVRAGDVLGELIGGVNGAHIHWGITDATIDGVICPAPFLTDSQQRELLSRIPANPDRLCYP